MMTLFLLIAELLNQLRNFSTFSLLGRMLKEIFKESQSLLIGLVFIWIAQAIFLASLRLEDYQELNAYGLLLVLQHSFFLILGEFEWTQEFYPVEEDDLSTLVFWIFFFFSSIFSLIILVNMFIALMSEEFARIKSAQVYHNYKERLVFMKNEFSRFPEQVTNRFKNHKYLIMLDFTQDRV